MSASSLSYPRLGALDVVASVVQKKLVHKPQTGWCGAAASPPTPFGNQAEGGKREEEADYQNVAPAPAFKEFVELLPSLAVSSNRVVNYGLAQVASEWSKRIATQAHYKYVGGSSVG